MTLQLNGMDKEELFREFEAFLQSKYDKNAVPVSIFCDHLTPFEAVTKYLIENKEMGYAQAGDLLNKDRQVVWITYKRAYKKHSDPYSIEEGLTIPIQHLSSDELSMFESVVRYLKEDASLSNVDISKLLHRDPRTIWTVYDRVKKKGGAA